MGSTAEGSRTMGVTRVTNEHNDASVAASPLSAAALGCGHCSTVYASAEDESSKASTDRGEVVGLCAHV